MSDVKDQQIVFTREILIFGLQISYRRLVDTIRSNPLNKLIYVDLMSFLSCAHQLINDFDSEGITIDESLEQARHYYQHLRGRLSNPIKKGEVALGSLSWLRADAPGQIRIEGTAMFSGAGPQEVPLPNPLDVPLGRDGLTILFDVFTEGQYHQINLTRIMELLTDGDKKQ